ncbi:hypothetical protein ElyMa_002180100 [Elysia marginata]|uniref:Uncharacterized protein n=1 Tax=Elysia marginata TaxID=1093978 RepID=A0AAV4FPW2_9GAST|nr:hypothetical protein ElyMa_002180100 [Elysia marginata]
MASPAMDPSGTNKQRTAKRDLEEEGGEEPETKRSLLRNDSPNSSKGSTSTSTSRLYLYLYELRESESE